MLDYADLLAGRALIAMGVMSRPDVIQRLAEHDRRKGQRARFVANLVEAGVVPTGAGQQVFAIVERNKRALAQAITLECLRRLVNVDQARLDRVLMRYQAQPRGHSLDKLLLLEGIVSEKEHRRLRDWTLDCIERQHARFLSRFRRSLNHHSSQTEQITGRTVAGQPSPAAVQPPGADLDPAARGSPTRADQGARVATRLDQAEQQSKQGRVGTDPDLPVIWAEENRQGKPEVKPELARRLVTSTEQMRAVSAPRFPVPGWIKSAGEEMGRVISGYRIFGKVGEGGMGLVYYAEHDDLGEPIALKLLPASKHHDEDALGRFHREILAMSFFDHPNVVSIKDAGRTEDGSLFIAMEFVDGEELMDILEEVDQIPPQRALPIFRQTLQGLGAAHQAGILHRDLKPENVLVGYKDGTAKLMDFGIARIMDRDAFEEKIYLSMAGTVTGTPEYLSPEQAADLPLDQRSDLYSFGILMYLCLSGEFPIEADSASEFITAHVIQEPEPLIDLVPSLPVELSDIVMKCLEKEPDDRYQSAEELIAAIDTLRPRFNF